MMNEHVIKIIAIEDLTHDVKRFTLEKPNGFSFAPGQATDVSINKPGWDDKKRPFTFTSLLNASDLEFIIKRYTDHQGVTEKLHQLSPGDELVIRDVWGAIEYKGPGCFIAGGAGITPFIAILRQLQYENRLEGNSLIFSNKTEKDIILKDELSAMLGYHATFMITNEKSDRYRNGIINEQYLEDTIKDYSQHFYVCGPPAMTNFIESTLVKLGAKPDAVVFER